MQRTQITPNEKTNIPAAKQESSFWYAKKTLYFFSIAERTDECNANSA